MAPRGPDGSGLVVHGNAGFGHRRLKIIDLSERAQQPMVDSGLGLTIAFNGCIYNYPELRQELEGKGYSFFSTGDTEVILKAWREWGEECVERFHGMFAFVLQERDSICRRRRAASASPPRCRRSWRRGTSTPRSTAPRSTIT